VDRVEERIRALHAASGELGDLLGALAERSRDASVTHPIARQRADVAVRLLNQTLSRLRKLPEVVEDLTEPE
jgi:Ser/Thr protein kinase RdoA (MazF antagonist)